MIKLLKDQCVGCGACENICPSGAVHMKEDDEGFRYFDIDPGSCIDCKCCEMVCPCCSYIASRFTDEDPLAVYAAWSNDRELRKNSSSGGVFGELAREILSKGGYVAGAAFTPAHRAEHRIIHSAGELRELQKSKYLQSDTGKVFTDVKLLLQKDELVLFTGTPCQCAGLLSFLGKEHDNLYLCDFVCHGVNSALIHQKYINEIEQEKSIRVDRIDHRNKAHGWLDYQFRVYDMSRSYDLGGKKENVYLRGFLTNLFLRRSCFSCRFKGTSRPTDITLGDCWGYKENEPDGVSLVMIQSRKGEKLWKTIETKTESRNILLSDYISSNPSVVRSAGDKWGRDDFFKYYAEYSSVYKAVTKLLGEKYG